MKNKIYSLDEIKKILLKKKYKKNKIVLCHGVFDLLHIGHLNHFREAKDYGDILVVTVTSDRYVNKGPNRPIFSQENRLKALAALEIIDYVALSNSPTSTFIINELKPNVYCKGLEYKFRQNDISGEIKNEVKAVKKNGGKIIYTKGETFSSSKLINLNETNNNQQKSSKST